MTSARLAAARVLLGVDRGRTTLSLELERQRGELDEDRDRALLFELVAGTLRWRNELDALLAACTTTRRLTGVDAPVLATLRLGAYQLTHLDRIPPHAVVHEAVELARELGRARATGFVNAVLRRLARGRPPRAIPIRPEPNASRVNQLAYLTTALSHPAWLVDRWLDRYGFDATERWCQFNNESPDVTLRSFGRLTPLEVLAALAKAGVAGAPARWVRDAVQVPPGSTGRLPAELMRELAIQDEASQIVAHAVGAGPDERVLDACAAPGGKTVVIASDMRRRGLIVAAEHRPRRLSVLRGVLDRAGVEALVVQIDATRPLPFGPMFDAVLLDAPCSGLGTLRRDPDVKWSRQPAHLATFATAQRDMLAAVASVVRPGGRLLYSTCSSEPEENEQVVTAFLAAHGDFSAVPVVPGPAVADGEQLVDDRGFLRTLPFRDRLDAFYAALLVRRRAA